MNILARTFVSLALDTVAVIYTLLVQAVLFVALLFIMSPAVTGLNVSTGLLALVGLVVFLLILRFCVWR